MLNATWLVALAVVHQSAASTHVAEHRRVLVLDLRNDGAAPEHARSITDSVVVGLSRFKEFEVISSEDMRRLIENESDKQSMGCNDETCLVELANAMGAQLIVHGSIAKLDSLHVVNLSLFDAKAGKSVQRESIQAQRLQDLPSLVEEATGRLIAPLRTDTDSVVHNGGAATATPDAQAATSGTDAHSGTISTPLAAGAAAALAGCVGIPLLSTVALTGIVGGVLCICPAGAAAACGLGAAGVATGYGVSGASFDNIAWAAGIAGVIAGVVGGLAMSTGAVVGAVAGAATDASVTSASVGTLIGAAIGGAVAAVLIAASTAIVTAIMADAPAPAPAAGAAELHQTTPTAMAF